MKTTTYTVEAVFSDSYTPSYFAEYETKAEAIADFDSIDARCFWDVENGNSNRLARNGISLVVSWYEWDDDSGCSIDGDSKSYGGR